MKYHGQSLHYYYYSITYLHFFHDNYNYFSIDVCVHLIETNPVFNRVHAVSEMFSFPHIKIEASRFCAAIIKNSQSGEGITLCIKMIIILATFDRFLILSFSPLDIRLKLLSEEKIYSLLLYLLEAEYTVLKNEGLIALTISASFNLSKSLLGGILTE